ncbi:antibiotic biosynthesis monooxygenase family protein [Polyangium sorediatum]|uniref:Antibiotic biosynthesis monooxygenase n=1 Tax=Polyangium sorediatum TaxID=889274 RepID=A0ABT6P486_9BACT|nr:antibiotic biosynthesis monooxygenase family protein [Polyangium sorediatum]MDI1435409.1 antibiotic biosynthesis monooxygenase [Polyangium sorediatum]
MYVVVNTIQAPEPELARIRRAFRDTAHDLDQFEGFLGIELWQDEGALLAVSRWSTREAFLAYPRSEVFRKHHKSLRGEEAMTKAQIKMYEAESIA